jgi:SAM-dependent methyltransferase
LAGEAGLRNVETLAVRAEDLGLPKASFDAALSRNCLMFVDDLPRALRAVRSALRPGARFAASVWGPVERNVFHGAPIAAVRKRGAIPTPQPEVVRAFSMPGGGAVADALRGTGFAGVEARKVPAPRRFPSFEEALRSAREFPTFVALLQLLSEAEREQVWSEVARDWARFASENGVELPGEQVVIIGRANADLKQRGPG